MGIVIRQSIKGTLVTYIGAFIGFLTTLFIVPKFLGEGLYGLTRVIIEAATLFAVIFQLGTSQSAVRFFPHFKSNDKRNNGFFFYLISIVTIGFLLFIPAFFLLKEPVANYFSTKAPLFVDYLYWVIPLTFFLLYWLTFEVYSNVLMRIAIPKFIREIVLRVLVVAVYMAYGLGHINLETFVGSFVCVYGVAMLATFFYVSRIGNISLKHDSSFITKPLKKDFFSYTRILLLGSLGGTLVSKIDVFMVAGMEGLDLTGIYAVAFFMVSIVDIPARSITAISAPIGAEALKKGDLREANLLYKKVSLHQLLIGSVFFLLIWINIDNIYEIIPNGEVYSAGKWVVLFIGLAKLIEVTLNFGGILIGFSKYYHWTLYFVFFISGITILFNWLFISKFGISGAALSTVLSVLISYTLQQLLILIKIKANPYSWGTAKIVGVIALAFLLNCFLPESSNPYFDGIYRTIVVGSACVLMIYYSKVSGEANQLIENSLGTVFSKLLKKR